MTSSSTRSKSTARTTAAVSTLLAAVLGAAPSAQSAPAAQSGPAIQAGPAVSRCAPGDYGLIGQTYEGTWRSINPLTPPKNSLQKWAYNLKNYEVSQRNFHMTLKFRGVNEGMDVTMSSLKLDGTPTGDHFEKHVDYQIHNNVLQFSVEYQPSYLSVLHMQPPGADPVAWAKEASKASSHTFYEPFQLAMGDCTANDNTNGAGPPKRMDQTKRVSQIPGKGRVVSENAHFTRKD